jgi:hypothetical protein
MRKETESTEPFTMMIFMGRAENSKSPTFIKKSTHSLFIALMFHELHNTT